MLRPALLIAAICSTSPFAEAGDPRVGPLTHPSGFVRTANGVVSANPPSIRQLPDGSFLTNDGIRFRNPRTTPPRTTPPGMIRSGNGFVSANPPSFIRRPNGSLLHNNGEITPPPRRSLPPRNVVPQRPLPPVQRVGIVNPQRDLPVHISIRGEHHTIRPQGRLQLVTTRSVVVEFENGLGIHREVVLRPGCRYSFQVSPSHGWELVEVQ